MTIVQMQYFRAVCRLENFTRAAEEQHISQPAMSAAMKELEAEVGVPLFKKTRNSLVITDAARTLLGEVDALLDQYDRLMQVASGLSLGRSCIHVGVSTLNGNLVYPAILAEFSKRHPDILVRSVEVPTPDQFELLDRGRLDVAINGFESAGRGFDGKLASRPLVRSEMVFCVGCSHPLASAKAVTVEQMAAQPLVLLEDRFSLTRSVLALFHEHGLEYSVLHRTDQMYSVERFVEQGVACGFLPREIADRNPSIVGIPFDGSPQGWINLWWRKGGVKYSAVRDFIDLVAEMYPNK